MDKSLANVYKKPLPTSDQNPLSNKYTNERVIESRQNCNAFIGQVKWSPVKSLWITLMYIGAIVGGYLFFSWSALLLFFITSAITLCLGHSLGMHRKLIHQSYRCPEWMEKLFVYIGTLVGLGGPFTMTYTHDMRDWAQRQSQSHSYYGHKQSIIKDAWWQIHCDIDLDSPPEFVFDKTMMESRFYRFIDKTAIWQQLPWALIFFLIGGWGWVFWGVCARVAVSVTGHWLIGYFAHNQGGQHWHVEGASVQGYDVNFCGLITFGECWHNNHHAFPGSAKLGLYQNQFDPGWWVLQILEYLGFVSDLKTNDDLPPRPELKAVEPKGINGRLAYD